MSIFNRAIPPYFLLDPALCAGPNSPWSKALRLKKSIISVSRAWYGAGVSFLYEDICIRRIAQIFDLFQTLKLSVKLGSLVKSFEIYCYIPLNITAEFNLCLNFLLGHFPRLSTFTFSSPCGLPSSVLVLPPSTNITHLRLSAARLEYAVVIGVLEHVKITMRSLQLSLGYHQLEVTDEISKQDVDLLALETLVLSAPRIQLFHIINHWKMPSLRRLTFSCWSSQTGPHPLLRLLEDHGRHLTFLHIPSSDLTLNARQLSSVAGHCPRLEHLIIYPEIIPLASWKDDSLVHSNVRWLFLQGWSNSSLEFFTGKAPRISSPRPGFPKQKFPALQGVRRILDLPRALIEWPERFEACLTSMDLLPFTIDAFQTQLQCTADCVSWTEPEWNYGVYEDQDVPGDTYTDSEVSYDSANSKKDEEVDESRYVQIPWTPEERSRLEGGSRYSYASASDSETSDESESYSDDEGSDINENARMDLAPAHFSSILADVIVASDKMDVEP